MVTPLNLSATSAMDGFKNYQSSSFSSTIPGQTLGAGAFVSSTASVALNNSNSVSQVQVQYSGLSSVYYVIYGTEDTLWASSTYEVETIYYFDSTNLNVFTVVVNQTGGNITIPTITINCRAFLYLAPF